MTDDAETHDARNKPEKCRPPGRRHWSRPIWFRLAAVGVGIVPFILAELILAAFGVGNAATAHDPFVGFAGIQPLFVKNEAEGVYEIAPPRRSFFRNNTFSIGKAPREFRVFCLGGSTVQGNPYSIETSFTTWLEIALGAADPSRQWRVVNCGGISYATYRLAPILEEVLQYEPDLVILYTGHNEFLEDRTYRDIKEAAPWIKQSHAVLSNSRIYWALRSAVGANNEPVDLTKPMMPAEATARLDYQGGLELYHRDPVWRAGVIEHFAFNVRRMAAACECSGLPIFLVDAPCNLRDCPPFKSQHKDGLTEADLADWERLWSEAREHYQVDIRKAVGLLQKARAIDEEYAGLHFELGKCYEAVGDVALAKAAYERALDLDVCPLRIIEPMNRALRAIAEETGAPLVEVRRRAEEKSRVGIPGGDVLVDHVHPSIASHQWIAGLFLDEMVRQGMVAPAAGWETERDRRFKSHLAALGDFYFVRGQQRLENLMSWAHGLADTPRPAPTTQKGHDAPVKPASHDCD